MPPGVLATVTVEAMRRRWEPRLAREHDELVVALDRGAVVGLALHGPSGDEPPLPGTELCSLYVARHWYGRGLAAQLVRRALGARPASLWVFEGNTRARAFYLREGWTATGDARIEPGTGLAEMRMVRD
ncbi:MAG: N-acetyltransferase family protein [Actinomycetes bacterium]